MRLLEQHKKKFFILSGLLFVLAIVGVLLEAFLKGIISTIFLGFLQNGAFLRFDFERLLRMAWRLVERNFMSYLAAWLGIFVGALGTILYIACYGAGAFHSAKTGKRSVFTLIGSGWVILFIALSVVLGVVYFVMTKNWELLLNMLVKGPSIFILAVCLFVFGIVKPKGPAIPIISAILILLTGGVISVFQIISVIVNLFSSYWPFVYNLFGFICSAIAICSSLCFYLGLLLHVPLAYYQPKVAEEIPETITETEDN